MFRVSMGCVSVLAVISAAPSIALAQSTGPIPRALFLSNMDGEFRKMDADRNGTVTAAELEEFQRAAAAVEAQTRNRALFARLDADRNGQISQAEFARMASNTPAPNIVSMLTRFDINRDRSITLIEYRTRTLANFDKLDVDKDGVVTEVEMKAGGIGG